MNKNTAIAIATQFITERGDRVATDECRAHFVEREKVWSVVFPIVTPDGEALDPGVVIVLVDPETEEASSP